MAYCEDETCQCPEGLIGNGVGADGCNSDGWAVRFNLYLPNGASVTSGRFDDFSLYVNEFVDVLMGGAPVPPGLNTSLAHTVEVLQNGKKLLTVNALFLTEGEADAARTNLQDFIDGAGMDGFTVPPGYCARVGNGTGVATTTEFPEHGEDDASTVFACDDCFGMLTLPFPFCIGGKPIENDLWVSTNALFTWNGSPGSPNCCNLDTPDQPNQPALVISRYDTDMSAGGVFTKTVTEGGVTAFVVRFRGDVFPADENTSLVFEATFFEDNTLRVAYLSNDHNGGVSDRVGVVSGDNGWLFGLGPLAPVQGEALVYSDELSAGAPTVPTVTQLMGQVLTEENLPVEPRVYAWAAPTTGAGVQVKPTGLAVESVTFVPECGAGGCWVVDVIYSTGEDNFNTFYLPNAVGDEAGSVDFDYTDTTAAPWSTWDKSAEATFRPAAFPCGTAQYDPTAVHDKSASTSSFPAPPDMASMCCIPEFLDLYRPLQAFNDFFVGHKLMTVSKEACDAGFVYSFARPGYTGPVQPIGPYSADAPVQVSCPSSRTSGFLHEPAETLCYDLRGEYGGVMHGNYPNGQLITWLVAAPNRTVTLRMNFVLSERNWDFVKVETCADAACDASRRETLVNWVSGDWGLPFEVESCTGFILVTFNCDGSVSSTGLGFEYYVTDQPCGTPADDAATPTPVPGPAHPLYSGTVVRNELPVYNGGATNVFETPVPPAVMNPTSAYIPMPQNMLAGKFRGMATSRAEFVTVVDPYIRQYRARMVLDESELRGSAGMLTGTVGVEHAVDTFIGLANFKPTGLKFLDAAAMQVALHLERTSLFTVASHGTNAYTFLDYVNMRLVAVYAEDPDFASAEGEMVRRNSTGAAHYVQVTLTLGAQYGANLNSGLIPLDSVRAGQGVFFDDADLAHICSAWDGGSLPRKAAFEAALAQECAPAATMCASPSVLPDGFVSYNVPLGVDALGATSDALGSNVFVSMVVSAVDNSARGGSDPNGGEAPWQVKTTMTGTIPIVDGGVNIFCDGIAARTDLQEVAEVDIVVGSAASMAELTRLRIISDVAVTAGADEGAVQIDSDSIEGGLLTLVLKGNASYFASGGNREVSVELEDAVTIHVMERDSDDGSVAASVTALLASAEEGPGQDNLNTDASGLRLDTDGYALNGAFFFTVDRAAQRAHLEPSQALLALCPWNPRRPAEGNIPTDTCVTRRDVERRGFPARAGGVSTAVEICAASNAHAGCSDCCTGLDASGEESQFLASVLGDSAYARSLAASFAGALDERYGLNGRFRRAYWINPGYEWTPTQTGGAALFALSQKLFLFALISLDENIADTPGALGPEATFQVQGASARRRMLLSSDALSAESGKKAAAASVGVSYTVTPQSLLSKAFEVPEDRVGTFRVEMLLSALEACMEPIDLQARLRETLDQHLSSGVASQYKTVQVFSLEVLRGGVQCEEGATRRHRLQLSQRQLLSEASGASAVVTMIVVFTPGSTSSFNLAMLEAMPDISSVAPVGTLSPKIALDDEFVAVWTWSEIDDGDDASQSGGASTTLIAAVAGAIGAAVVLVAGAVLLMRRRAGAGAEEAATCDVESFDCSELKAQLHAEVCGIAVV